MVSSGNAEDLNHVPLRKIRRGARQQATSHTEHPERSLVGIATSTHDDDGVQGPNRVVGNSGDTAAFGDTFPIMPHLQLRRYRGAAPSYPRASGGAVVGPGLRQLRPGLPTRLPAPRSSRRQPTSKGGDDTPLASAATLRLQLLQRLVRQALPHEGLLPGNFRQQLTQRLVRQALPHGGLLPGHLRRQQQQRRQQETVVSGR